MNAMQTMPPPPSRWWLVAILLASLCINCVGIRWGLPNGNTTWATDSFGPMTPLAIAKHEVWGGNWNSGWFYFKYPIGHPLVLLAAELPYLGWLRVTGEMQTPKAAYPYGFRHPEHALTTLALLTRLVSVLMGVGIVGLAYLAVALLFGVSAGLVAAVLVAGCYPIVFYAHTTNVDLPLLFWIVLAVAATLVSASRTSTGAALISGTAMAMGLLTKEAAIGVVVVLPLVWLLARRTGRPLNRDEVVTVVTRAAMGFAAATVVMGDVWWNPMGYVNRWRYLLRILPEELRQQLVPYQPFAQAPELSVGAEVQRLWHMADVAHNGLTGPILLLCAVGVVWAAWYRRRQAALLLVLIVGYYISSLRAYYLVNVRYAMPALFVLLLFGGAIGGALIDWIRGWSHLGARRLAMLGCASALAMALLPGIEVDRLLVRDPRYAAEAWFRSHAPAEARMEVYQPATYLPRFGREARVVKVPLEERTVESFRQRQPDLVVLSSGGRPGLVNRRNLEWQQGKPIVFEAEEAKRFFQLLRSEQLGYRRVAQFRTPTCWITPRISSLNPEITVFSRAVTPQAGSVRSERPLLEQLNCGLLVRGHVPLPG